jgi:DNA modification methylase
MSLLLQGDCIELMRTLPDASVDSIVTDPPYELGFMGKGWDKASKSDRGDGNSHPTVKPTALMRYLCRLVTPPGGTVLDPFMGSGTTGVAAVAEGFFFIGCELSPEYLAIAEARIYATA